MRPSLMVATTISALSLAACSTSESAGSGSAADYPSKSIDIVVTTGPGGLTDIAGRALASCLKELGETAVVKNVPGASGAMGLRELINARPDGYTLAVTPSTGLTLSPQMDDLGFSLDDVRPVALLAQVPDMFAARKGAPIKTGEDLLAAARSNPGATNIGTPGPTSPKTLVVKALEGRGIKMKSVPMGSNDPEVITSMLGGTVDIGALSATAPVREQIKAGKIIPLVALTKDRIPGVTAPTLRELGIEFSFPAMHMAVVAAQKLPDGVLDVLAPAIEKCHSSGAFTKTIGKDYVSGTFLGPDEAANRMREDAEFYKGVVGK